jgi:cytochrome b
MELNKWDITTRILHIGLAVTITFQLFDGLFIATPGVYLYLYLHEAVGIFASVIILTHWLWSWANGSIATLYPWNYKGISIVLAESKDIFTGKMPMQGNRIGLSSFVHGLGLLAITGMAITGIIIFFIMPGGHGALSSSNDFSWYMDFAGFHRELSYLVWAYWIGHVGFSIAHQVKGNHIFKGIFTFTYR